MKQCLIVDGSRVIRRVAARILEDLKFEAVEAEDGASALEACRHKMPDAILVDGHLPDMPSADFLRTLRREANGGNPVAIFCTTENDVAHIARGAKGQQQPDRFHTAPRGRGDQRRARLIVK